MIIDIKIQDNCYETNAQLFVEGVRDNKRSDGEKEILDKAVNVLGEIKK